MSIKNKYQKFNDKLKRDSLKNVDTEATKKAFSVLAGKIESVKSTNKSTNTELKELLDENYKKQKRAIYIEPDLDQFITDNLGIRMFSKYFNVAGRQLMNDILKHAEKEGGKK